MAPHQIRKAVSRQLRETRDSMMDLGYLLTIELLPDHERKAARSQLADVHLAYLKMRTAELSDIRDQLRENELALTKGIASVQHALEDLQKVGPLLEAVTSFLKIVGRVVALT